MCHRAFLCQRLYNFRCYAVTLDLRQISGPPLHLTKITVVEDMFKHCPHLGQLRASGVTAKPIDHTLDLICLAPHQRSLQRGHLRGWNHRVGQPQTQTVSCPQKMPANPKVQGNRAGTAPKKQACPGIGKQANGRLWHRQPCRLADHHMPAGLRQSGSTTDHQPVGQPDHRLVKFRNRDIHHIFGAEKRGHGILVIFRDVSMHLANVATGTESPRRRTGNHHMANPIIIAPCLELPGDRQRHLPVDGIQRCRPVKTDQPRPAFH